MNILMLGSGSIKSNFTYRLLALGKALHRRGHKVAIIAPKADKYNHFTPEHISSIDGVRILQPFQFATKRPEINLLPYLFGAARLVLGQKPDVVYIYKPTPVSLVGLIARLRRIPVVLDMDDLGSEVMKIEGHPLYMRKLVEWCEKLASRYANCLVVASTFLRDTYSAAFPAKRIVWIPNGVEPEWFGPVLPAEHVRQVVFMGSLNRENILGPLLEVWPDVLRQHPDARALVIGDGQYLSQFKARARKLRLESSITFTGWLPLAQAQTQLRAGDVGYSYMPNQKTVRAASNMKVPQYMARGVVPLVSNVGDLPWMVENGAAGYIAAAGNAAALQQALIHALADPLRKQKSNAARQYAKQQFDWDIQAAKVDRLLADLYKRKA